MIAKYDIDPDDFYFASTLNAAAITALPEEVNGKNRLDSEKKLKSNLYLCIGDEAQRIFKARKPTVNIIQSTAPAISIKQEPVNNLRRGQGFFRGRGRAGRGGYTQGSSSSGGSGNNRRCYNCDAPNFTLDHIASCPANGATCNSCRKLGHFERTCRGIRRGTNQWRGRGRVGLVREENEHHQSTQNVNELNEDPVSWVSQQGCGEKESMTSGSDDYMVMSIKRKKNETELKIPGARVQEEVSGKKMLLWIDSGSPVTIFSINDLKTTLGKANIQLQPSKEEFLDYNNNRINILGKVTVMMSLNGWAAPAQVSVISGNHQSILGRDLMGTLGRDLMGTQRKKVMGITGEGISQEEEEYDELQTYFCKFYPNLFTRIGKIRNAKVKAEFFENLKPIQQKGRRMPISLQEKVDKKIHRLINEGHIVK